LAKDPDRDANVRIYTERSRPPNFDHDIERNMFGTGPPFCSERKKRITIEQSLYSHQKQLWTEGGGDRRQTSEKQFSFLDKKECKKCTFPSRSISGQWVRELAAISSCHFSHYLLQWRKPGVDTKDYKAKMFQRRGDGEREICRWFGIFPMEKIEGEQLVYI
jgi:hypothetical protein